ncbi:MAG: nucleotidyltransferase family protein [Elusimicrobia bacterium]|nr:nucleotidyltransferase family protein [Elusimicrobiota bacterium]
MKGARVLLLAAGNGKRAGGPKAWKEFAGKPLLQDHVEFFSRRLGATALSVAIQPSWAERCRSLSPDVRWVPANSDAPPMDSLQRLIKDSPSARSFILHVDMPVFDVSVYETLWAAEGDAVVPVFDGRRGHPVLLSPKALNEVSRLDPSTSRLDVWLHENHVHEVSVPTDIIFKNLNGKTA